MAVPRNRLSNARRNKRRSHHAKKPKNTAACKRCGGLKMPHMICQSCGAYGDRIIVEPKAQK